MLNNKHDTKRSIQNVASANQTRTDAKVGIKNIYKYMSCLKRLTGDLP